MNHSCSPSAPKTRLVPLGTVCYQSGFICYAEPFPFVERDYYGADFDSCTVDFSGLPGITVPVTLSGLLEAIQLSANLCGLYHSGVLDSVYWFDGVGSPICFAGLDGVSGPANLGLSFVPTGDPPPADPSNPADPSYVFFPQIAGQPDIAREATLWYPALPTGKPDTSQPPLYCDSTTGVELTPAELLTIAQCPDTADRPAPVQADVTNVTQAGPDVNIDTSNSVGDPAIHFQYVTIESTGGGVTESDETPCGTLPVYGSTGQAFTFTGYTIQNGDEHIERIYDGPSCLTATLLSVDIKRCDISCILEIGGAAQAPCPLVFPFDIADPNGGANINIPDQATLDNVYNGGGGFPGYAGGGFAFNAGTCCYERVVNPSAPPVDDVPQVCGITCLIAPEPAGGVNQNAKTTDFHAEDFATVNIDATVNHQLILEITHDRNNDPATPAQMFIVNWTGIPAGLPNDLDTLNGAGVTVTMASPYDGTGPTALAPAQQSALLALFSLSHSGTEFNLVSNKEGVRSLLQDGDNWTPATAIGAQTPYIANGTEGLGWTWTYSASNASCAADAVMQTVCPNANRERIDNFIVLAPVDEGLPSDGSFQNQARYIQGLRGQNTDPRFKTFDGSEVFTPHSVSWPVQPFPPGTVPGSAADVLRSEVLHSAILPGTPGQLDGGSLDLIRDPVFFTGTDANKTHTNGSPGVAYIYANAENGNYRYGGTLQAITTALFDIPYTIAAGLNAVTLAAPFWRFNAFGTPSECCTEVNATVEMFGFANGRWLGVEPTGGTLRWYRGGTLAPISAADVLAPINPVRVTGGVIEFSLGITSGNFVWFDPTHAHILTGNIPYNLCPVDGQEPWFLEVVFDWLDPTDLVTTYQTYHAGQYSFMGWA